MPHEVVSRADALARGLKHYFTGKACKRAHVEPRAVSTRSCLACNRERVAETRKADPEKAREEYRRYDAKHRKERRVGSATRRIADPEKARQVERRSYEKHRDKRIAKTLRWRAENPEKYEEYLAREECKESARAATRKWTRANRDAVNAYRRAAAKSNVGFRLRINLANRINQAVRYIWGHKSARTLELIGCTIKELRGHIARQFLPGMSWKNYGYGNDRWHIDHIRPCAAYDLTDAAQQRACFHFSNLQPLWQPDNFRKNKRMEPAECRSI